MKFLEEYRDAEVADRIGRDLRRITTQTWTIMEVCGGQTHSILQYGIEDFLPENIKLVHGPGCPVCVTPISHIDRAIEIALQPDVIFCSFGDMLRVPGSSLDLLDARARGADVRFVYSPLDSLELARSHPEKNVVFLAVGFETTAPANAMALIQAKRLSLPNFFVLCSHVTVPPVCTAILQAPGNLVQAFIGPGHVCSVMGYREYEPIAARYRVPIVISGFEPIDLLFSIHRTVVELEHGGSKVINQYKRAVQPQGNERARKMISQVFDVVDREWRGLGWIPKSGYKLSHDFATFDADLRFETVDVTLKEEPKNCISGQILRGMKKPSDCIEFGKGCTPETPLGATMVSSEGTCATYFKFKRFRMEGGLKEG